MRTFGVEEELLLVDGVTGSPRALARTSSIASGVATVRASRSRPRCSRR
jgi:hypothetical protein